MILDVIVRPSREEPCDLGPFIAVLLVGFKHGLFFLLGPGLFVDVWIEMVVPAVWGRSYRSRHCLPVRFSMPYFEDIFSLISAQLRVPCFLTSAMMALSS